jgi:hypothetical protein
MLLAAGLAACGGGGDADSGSAAPQDTTEVQQLPPPTAPAPTPDLSFSPPVVELQPGQHVDVQVSISTGADLRDARFALGAPQDGVTTSFEASSDGRSGTLTVAASEASQAAERDLMVLGASGVDAMKSWVGPLRVKTAAGTGAKEIFVDPKVGNDQSAGTQTQPLKTLGQAVLHATSGDTVRLAAGSYTKLGNGETYPITIPSGVTLTGTLQSNGSKATFLSPQTSAENAVGLILAGDATVRDLEMDVFGTAIRTNVGTQTLSNLNLILNRLSLSVGGTANTTLANSQAFLGDAAGIGGVAVGGNAKFTMDGGVIETGSVNCQTNLVGISANGKSTLTTISTTLRNIAGTAVSLNGSKATLGLFAERTVSNGCKPGSHIQARNAVVTLAPSSRFSTVNGQSSIEFDQFGGEATINVSSINGGDFDRLHGAGIAIQLDNTAKLTMSHSHILGARTGVSAFFNTGGVTIRDSIFQAVRLGIETTTGLKLRNTEFQLNVRAVSFFGSNVGADLGTAADPGNNAFFNPSTFEPELTIGVDFGSAGAGLVDAAGNKWNFGIQGADINGHFPHGIVTGPTPDNRKKRNFNLPNANTRLRF